MTVRNEHRHSITIRKYELTERKKKETVCNARDYFIVAKFLALFSGIFENYLGVSNFFFIYFTISRGTLNGILRNRGRETLLCPSISVSVRLSSLLPSFL